MKSLAISSLIVVSLATLCHCEHISLGHNISPRLFEDVINQTLEQIKSELPNPVDIPNLDLNLPEDGVLVGNASVSNFQAFGFNGFQTTALSLSILNFRLNFTVVFPSININTDYLLNVLLGELVPLYGQGRANINLRGLQVVGTGKANLTGGLSISDLRVSIGISDTVFDIHGALNNEDFSLILSSILNDVVTLFINEHPDLISDILSPIVETLLNLVLKGDQNATTVAPQVEVIHN